MASAYATFRKICAHHKIPKEDWKFNGKYHYIEFRNPATGAFDEGGSRIDLIDLKYQPADPLFERFGSTEYTGGWIEEAGEVHFSAFDVLKARVGRWKNQEFGLLVPKILITCNPKQNWLYRVFYKPWKKGNLSPEYAFIQALYKDNPHTRDEAEQRLEQISDPVMRMRLKLGLWEYNAGDNSLVEYDALTDLFTNTVEKATEKYFTGDIARHGSDRVALADWLGFDIYKIILKSKRGIDQTANDIKEDLRIEHIPYSHAIADEDGVGGGVVDLVKGIKGFIGNSTPLKVKQESATLKDKDGKVKANYRNLRSQCGFMLAEKINNHQIAISASVTEVLKEEIIEDLQALLKRKETPDETVLQLIPKEEIKDAIGRSPDLADMMLMRMYFELDAPVHFVQNNDVGGVAPYAGGVDTGFKTNNNVGGVEW